MSKLQELILRKVERLSGSTRKTIKCFLVAFAILITGVTTSSAATRFVIVVDLSKSAKSVFPQYRNAIRRMLEQNPLNIGDSVTILGITDDSFGHPIILLQDSIQSLLRNNEPELKDCSKFGKDSFQYKSCMSINAQNKEKSDREWNEKWQNHFTRERERLLSKWDDNRTTPWSSSTDVLGALKYAEQLFATWKGEKELLIFSDMRHNTRGIDISHTVRLDSKFMDDIKMRGLIPRLRDVSVAVRGVHTEGKDPAYFDSLEEFWKRYFREAGCSLHEFSVE